MSIGVVCVSLQNKIEFYNIAKVDFEDKNTTDRLYKMERKNRASRFFCVSSYTHQPCGYKPFTIANRDHKTLKLETTETEDGTRTKKNKT